MLLTNIFTLPLITNLVLTWLASEATAIVDPIYAGIKTKSYRRDPLIAEAFEQQQLEPQQRLAGSHGYQLPNVDANVRLSAFERSYNTDNNNYQRQQQHNQGNYKDYHRRQQQQLQEQPLYKRNNNERRAADIAETSNWGDAENAITEYYAGCPAEFTGQLPYAYDCRRFLNCWKGRGHIQSCGPGTVFNPETLECDRPDKVACGVNTALGNRALQQPASNPRAGRLIAANSENSNSLKLCPPGLSGLQPHPSDCTKFVNCANGVPFVQVCGPGTAYSATMMVCDFVHKVNCGERALSQPQQHDSNAAILCPPNVSGLYEHPFDCTKYLNCDYGTTNVFECGPGTAFDSANMLCDYQEKLHCVAANEHARKDVPFQPVSSMPNAANIMCPNDVEGLFPYPFDYTRYLSCQKGHSTALVNCIGDQVFSIPLGYCVEQLRVLPTEHVTAHVSPLNFEYSLLLAECPPDTDGPHLYPFDCGKYVQCASGQRLLVLDCPPNMVYSFSNNLCMPAASVPGNERVKYRAELMANQSIELQFAAPNDVGHIDSIVQCPKAVTDLFAYPFDRSQYVSCVNGILLIRSCPKDFMFSVSQKQCLPRHDIAANDRVANARTEPELTALMCPMHINGYLLHPFDCTKYLHCQQGHGKIQSCAAGTVFSISQSKCIARDQVEAFDRVEYLSETQHEFSDAQAAEQPLTHTLSCPTADALSLYMHPYDNGKYLRCTVNGATVESCAPGMVFSISRKSCLLTSQIDGYDRSAVNARNYTSHAAASNSMLCLPGAFGLAAYRNDCTKYIQCVEGIGTVHSCATGTAWSVAMETCDKNALLECAAPQRQWQPRNEKKEVARIECPEPLNGRYPHPFDYRKYLNCRHGNTIVKQCPAGYAFSISNQMCSLMAQVPISERVQHRLPTTTNPVIGFNSDFGVKCPASTQGRFIYPFASSMYIICEEGGKTFLADCPIDSSFSPTDYVCLADQVVARSELGANNELQPTSYGWNIQFVNAENLFDASNSPSLCSPLASGIYAHPFDVRKFLHCVNGMTYEQDCAPGTAWNSALEVCDYEQNIAGPAAHRTNSNIKSAAQYAAGMQEATVPTCPPAANGLQAHPYDCTKFVNCADGMAYVQNCAPGTAWNSAMEVCDFIDRIDCGGRQPSAHVNLYSDGSNRESKAYQPVGSTGNVLSPSSRQPYAGAYEPASTTPVTRTGYRDRWSNMHMARPDASGYRPRPGDTQLPAWSGSASSVQQQLPLPGITIEEGSLQPNRNYHKVYSTPLAPMSPRTLPDEYTTSTTTEKTNLYYAQPVLSQEDASDDVYSHVRGTTAAHLSPILPVNLHSSRTNHSRDYNARPKANPWKPIAQPPQFYPTYNSYAPDQVDSPNPYTHSHNPPSPHLLPPLPSDLGQMPLPETAFRPVTKINIDNLPVASEIDITNYDQLPAETQSVGSVVPLDDANLYGGLQPPLPAPPQATNTISVTQRTRLQPIPTANRNSNRPAASDQSNLYGGLQPPLDSTQPEPQPLTSTTPRSNVRTFQIYPPIKNATSHGTPQYSDSYAGVAHSGNNTWARKLPTVATRSNAPASEEYSVTTSTSTARHGLLPPPYNREYYKPTSAMSSNEFAPNDEHSQLPISEAIRALLRPYYNRDEAAEEIVAKNAESHIMNLLPRSSIDEDSDMTPPTTTTAAAAAATTLKKTDIDTDDDVELILAGEQHSLIDLTEPTTVASKPELTTNIQSNQSKPGTRGHNREFHLRRPNMPDPFRAGEQNSFLPSTTYNNKKAQLPAQIHHHHHHHPPPHHRPPSHHDHMPGNGRHPHHSREFHLRHPHLSKRFPSDPETNTNTDTDTGTETETDNDEAANGRPNEQPNDYDLPNPNAEPTTPKTRLVFEQIDPRSSFLTESEPEPACDFDCGNAKCINSFEVCDGVNNCGNRKDESQCDHLGYEVRLTGGETANVGRVEVKILGKWGYVCDDKFGLRDADVVCKELGFQLGAMEVRGNSFYPPIETNPSFVMDEVDCRGNETTLKDCDFKGWGINNCGPDEVVGVACKVPQLKCPKNYWLCSTSKECIPPAFVCDNTPDCEDKSDESDQVCNSAIEYRLDGGRTANEGRLEVLYRGKWGSVCDDDFGLKEAQVACNSLGYYGKPKIEKNIFGPGSGPIWLDQVACFGNETTLDKCSHWTWGEHNCNHTEDVGLKCTAGPPPRKSTSTSSIASVANNDDNNKENTETLLEDIGLYMGEVERSSKFLSNHQRRCGHFKDDLFDAYEHPENERVLNGTVAKRGRHPWQATIRLKGRGGISSHWCGAVLISKKHLLTAAHCLVGYQKGAYFVRMGDHYANIAESSEIDTFIENWYIHEKFRDRTHMNNDIAVIVLKNPVRFNDYIQPICLPEKGVPMKVNRMCTISGWGSIKSGISTPSNILRAAQVPLLADDVCRQPHVYGGSMTEGMFCAGLMDESVDACDGDSGGPLVCSDEDGETLYGIISWGQHCGYPNKPGVYVRVEKYIDWIYEKINLSMQQAG